MNQDQWEVGKILQTAREQQGLSKRAAARISGLSESWWRKAEAGTQSREGQTSNMRPEPLTLVKAAQGLGISPSELLAAAGHDDAPYVNLSAMRRDIHQRIDMMDDDHLPTIQAFLLSLTTAQG